MLGLPWGAYQGLGDGLGEVVEGGVASGGEFADVGVGHAGECRYGGGYGEGDDVGVVVGGRCCGGGVVEGVVEEAFEFVGGEAVVFVGETEPNGLIALLWLGAAALASGTLTLGVGLLTV